MCRIFLLKKLFVELDCEPLRAINAILKYTLSLPIFIVILSKRGSKKGTREGGEKGE